VGILAEAQAIVDEGLGASLSSSTIRDHILVHLSGAMVGDWFERREKAAKTRDLPLRPSAVQEFLEEAAGVRDEIRTTALQLTQEMMASLPGKARDREWVWETFNFFFQKALEAIPEKEGG